MNRRALAQRIILLRRVLLDGMLAGIRGDEAAETALAEQFEALANDLPVGVQMFGGLRARVIVPCERKIHREGILAQQSVPEHVHAFVAHAYQPGSWICWGCGLVKVDE